MVTVDDLLKVISYCFASFDAVIYLCVVIMITFYVSLGVRRILVGYRS